jgi:hypothetical protein
VLSANAVSRASNIQRRLVDYSHDLGAAAMMRASPEAQPMALRDPVAVYNAANNAEALFVRDGLTAAGIEAFVIEDLSIVGGWVGGLIPEIHKPQVWVERADMGRAVPVLDEFEARAARLRDANSPEESAGSTVEVVCEECGARASFPAVQRGSVQQCPNCREYIDVGEAELPEGWADAEVEPDDSEAGSERGD